MRGGGTRRSVAIAREEMADELGDVLAPLAQRRKPDRDDVQAIEQILAETAGGDFILEVARSRRKHADVDLDRALAADAVIALVGQHAQDLGLGGRRHVRDLVEEQGAAMGMFEQPGSHRAVESRFRTAPPRRARGSSSPPKGR